MPLSLLALTNAALDGLVLGAVWYLLALGPTVYRWLTGHLDMTPIPLAIGGAAFAFWLADEMGLNSVSAAGISVVGTALLAVPLAMAFRYIVRVGSAHAALLFTLAWTLAMGGALALLVGPGPYTIQSATIIGAGPEQTPLASLLVMGAAVAALIALWSALRFSWLGLTFRAVAERPATASLLGLSPQWFFVGLSLAGAALATLATIFGADALSPHMGSPERLLPGLVILVMVIPLGGIVWLYPIAIVLGQLQVMTLKYVPEYGNLPMFALGLMLLVARSEIAARQRV